MQASALLLLLARRAAPGMVHFEGVDDRSAAQGAFVGTPLSVAPLPDRGDGWYVDQLIGAEAVDGTGEALGICVAVVANPAHDLLELDRGPQPPFRPVFITAVRQGSISVDLPEGLLDL